VSTLSKLRRMVLRDHLSVREASRRLGISRNTARKWLEEDEMTEPRYPQRAKAPSCRIPDDCIDSKRYPLFIAREAMRALVYDLTQAQGEST